MTVSRPVPTSGLIPPLATPLANGRLDRRSLESLVHRLIDAGVDGVFPLGTTGEAPSLGRELKRDLVRAVCEISDGRVPVLAGLLETSADDTIDLASLAADAGATALVLAPPYYLDLHPAQVVGYVERLVPKLPLPVLYYHIPDRTRASMPPQAIADILRIDGVAGFKDSSGDLASFRVVRELVSKAPLFWGPEESMADAIAAGANGAIAGGTNLFPSLYVSFYRAAIAGDGTAIAECQQMVDRIGREIYSAAREGSGYLLGLKYALGLLGIGDGRAAEPLGELPPLEREDIRRAVACISDRIGELVGSAF